MRRRAGLLAIVSACSAALAAASCNVAPPPSSTGGTSFDLPDAAPDADEEPVDAGADAAAPLACDRGVLVVESDYRSTNIVVSHLDGTTLSASFVSSGATKPGLALALSGDVDVPFGRPRSGRVVLIDRYGTNVMTWMDVASGAVLAQLPLGQGFESNPHDYVEIDDTHAWVSRYGSNVTPGGQPFDEGGDLVVLDTTMPSIVGRIAMPEENPSLLPCPGELNWLADTVVVTLGRWSRDFTMAGDGRFVGVSPLTATIAWSVDVPGLSACGRLMVSPDGRRAAIACSGQYDFDAKRFDATHSDIVLFDVTTRPPVELKRFGASAQFDAGIQPTLAFASNAMLMGLALDNGTSHDRAFLLDVDSGEVRSLLEKSAAFVLGTVRCAPGCGDICLLPDADTRTLHRWRFTGDRSYDVLDDAPVESVIGLPPRTIGGI
jgi:hypothetical protein